MWDPVTLTHIKETENNQATISNNFKHKIKALKPLKYEKCIYNLISEILF